MDFDRGFQTIKKCLAGANTQLQSEIATLEARFNEADRSERLFGSSENVRNERSQIVYSLNELAFKYCGVGFNDLCTGLEPTISPPAPREISTSPEITGVNIDSAAQISGDVSGANVNTDQRQAVSMSMADRASLQLQLNEARTNLKLIEERTAEYVLEVDVPLQLIKEQRRLRERIAELERQLG
jgi:hypothetical protein